MRLVLNTMKKLLALIPVVLVLCGCATSVPATHFEVNPKTGQLSIVGPKDTSMTNVVFKYSTNGFELSIGSYGSKNSPDAIAAQAAGAAQILHETTGLTSAITSAAVQGAAKAAIP